MSAAADTSTRALTERQRRFAEHYARTGNGAESCRLAGYANKAARIAAQQVLSNSNVVALIDELRKERLERLGVRPDRVLEELAASAFVDPKDAFDEDGDLLPIPEMPERARRAIKKIKVRNHYDRKTGEQTGRDVEIEFNDKLRANEILGRHLGILKETPVQVNQQNVFAAIVERAQGTALVPSMLRDDDDTIEGEVIAEEDAPPQDMAGDNAFAAFNAIDDGEDEGEQDGAETQITQAPVADPAPEPLFRSRRKHSRLNW